MQFTQEQSLDDGTQAVQGSRWSLHVCRKEAVDDLATGDASMLRMTQWL